ncbi:MAG: enoyl-CoA hydratase/isomerase family protein [Acidobacteria bacterium]|nr:enoyl-CoA hydratase/isomerase family protein [Acidobacteriota bacterium]
MSLTLDGSLAVVTIARPPENALDTERLEALEEKLREVSRQRQVKVVALSSHGRDFCTGLEMGEQRPGRVDPLIRAFHSMVRFLLALEVPTVALIQGRALGAGAEVALACDFVFAETTATIGFPEIRLGVFPPVASVLLERRVGRAKAADLIFCGAAMTAEAGERKGLVNALVNPGDLVNALETIHQRLEPFSASTLRLAKRGMLLGGTGDVLSALLAVERSYLGDLMKTEDAREGVSAYLEGRGPVWRNR